MNNTDNSAPAYLRLVDKIKVEIFGGRLQTGAQIISVRDLAIREQVNPNTVQRALMELEKEKLLYSKERIGRFVTDDIDLIRDAREKYASVLTTSYKNKMHDIGAEIKVSKTVWLDQEIRNKTHRVHRFD